MLLTNRFFERKEASREAKSIYIFCEGAKREVQYFHYFKEIDSRINIEIYQLSAEENNSPNGLYEIATKLIVKSQQNPNPKYEFIDGLDEVWFIVDTDTWGANLSELRDKCNIKEDWNIAQSNPCFEVWLYYHCFVDKPVLDEMYKCSAWKEFLNRKIRGGFDSRKHPIYIKKAIDGSIKSFEEENGVPKIGSTEVHNLCQNIYPLIREKIEKVLSEISE